MKKKRLISLLLAAFITVMPLSFSFAAPTPEPTADNTTSTVTSPDGTTRTVTSKGNRKHRYIKRYGNDIRNRNTVRYFIGYIKHI